MNKVCTDFKNVTSFTGWWVAKRIIGLESYLVEGEGYKVTHQTIGDASDKYYCIECAAHPNGGMWVLAERGDYVDVHPLIGIVDVVPAKQSIHENYGKVLEKVRVGGKAPNLKSKYEGFGVEGNESLKAYCEKLTPDLAKQDRIIDIPPDTEVCHTLDLERVQYVGIADKDGHYLVTLGWTESIKLNEDIYPRKEFVKKWKAYHGQEV